jgi:hypothetical protein
MAFIADLQPIICAIWRPWRNEDSTAEFDAIGYLLRWRVQNLESCSEGHKESKAVIRF